MPALHLIMDGTGVWKDLRDEQVTWLKDADITIAGLPCGMTSGRPSVAIRINLPDGKIVVAETSLRLFQSAARAFAAKYGDQAE